jgi:hypothetical protein
VLFFPDQILLTEQNSTSLAVPAEQIAGSVSFLMAPGVPSERIVLDQVFDFEKSPSLNTDHPKFSSK